MKTKIIASAMLLAISGITFTAIADEATTLEAGEKETSDFKQQSWGEWRETFSLNSPNKFSTLADEIIEDAELSDAEKWIRLFNLSKQQHAYAECESTQECNPNISSIIEGGQHPGEGEGMGLLAKELGYKPGSEEFKLLKQVIKDGDSAAMNSLLDSSPRIVTMAANKTSKREKAAQQAKAPSHKKTAAKERDKKDKKDKKKK